MCTVGGRIGWIGTRSGTARRPGIADPTTMVTTVVATTPRSDSTIQYTTVSPNRITTLSCSTISFENNVSYFIFVVCASRKSPYCRLYLIFCSDLNNTSHISTHIFAMQQHKTYCATYNMMYNCTTLPVRVGGTEGIGSMRFPSSLRSFPF